MNQTMFLLRSNSLRSTERKLFYPSIPVIMRHTKDMVGYASGSECSLIFYRHYTLIIISRISVSGKCFKSIISAVADEDSERQRTLILRKIVSLRVEQN